MTPPPQKVVQWVNTKYPRPSVDPEWLEGCYSWIESEHRLDPATEINKITHHVELQLLQSSLSDSMLEGTGLPLISPLENTTIRGPPVLVEVVSISEIGHSAFAQLNVHQARIERADLAGLAQEEDEEAGSIQNYPRSMLKFELSDGSTVMKAIEYRRLPELSLGETPLGYKMLLKDVLVRRGIALLEPSKVVLKGYQSAERMEMQDSDFVKSLRERLGHEDVPVDAAPEPPRGPPAAARALEAAQPRPRQATAPLRTASPPRPAQRRLPSRSPLQDIDEPPEPQRAGPSRNLYHDDEDQPRRRKLPASRSSPSPPPPPSPRRAVQSHYFSGGDTRGKGKERFVDLSRELRLSPHRQGPVVVPDSDDEYLSARKMQEARGVVSPDADIAKASGDADGSSDFDHDFDFDDAELHATLDKVEKEALAPSRATTLEAPSGSLGGRATSLPVNTTTSSSQTYVNTRAQHPSGITSRAVSRGLSGTPARTQPAVHLGVVSIDDESDEKENVPVPTRRVRRRVAQPAASQPRPEDIIEISD